MKYLIDEDHWHLTEYLEERATLLSRLKPKTAEFLAKDSFHDGKVLDIHIINKSNGKKKDPTTIKMKIRHWNGKIYQATWKKVYKFSIDFDITRNVYANKPHKIVFKGKGGLDEWGYDELLPIDEKRMHHEIHLHSQAVLHIYCSSFKIKKLS